MLCISFKVCLGKVLFNLKDEKLYSLKKLGSLRIIKRMEYNFLNFYLKDRFILIFYY